MTGVQTCALPIFICTSGAGAITTNTWQHIAVARDSGGHVNLYINGVRVAQTTYSFGAISSSYYIFAGIFGTNTVVSGRALDEVRISDVDRYSGASSFTVPVSEYTSGTTSPAYYNFGSTNPLRSGYTAANANDLVNKAYDDAANAATLASAEAYSDAKEVLDVRLDGSRTMTGALNMGGHQITGGSAAINQIGRAHV